MKLIAIALKQLSKEMISKLIKNSITAQLVTLAMNWVILPSLEKKALYKNLRNTPR